MIIGAPKSIDEIPVLPTDAFEELAAQLNPQLQQGHPLEIPVAMPFGMLCQLAKTLKAYHAVVVQAAAPPSKDVAAAEDEAEELREAAKALLAVEPPPPPSVVQAPSSRLILPK